jgi:hypothetical protein
MYINAVGDSITLCLQHDCYNIVFKLKKIIYSFWVRTSPPPPLKILCMRTWPTETLETGKCFYPLPSQSRGKMPKQFWKLTSSLLTDIHVTSLIHFAKRSKYSDVLAWLVNCMFITTAYYCRYTVIAHDVYKRTQVSYARSYTYTCSFLHLCCISCCPHADQILPKFAAPHEGLRRPVLRYMEVICQLQVAADLHLKISHQHLLHESGWAPQTVWAFGGIKYESNGKAAMQTYGD